MPEYSQSQKDMAGYRIARAQEELQTARVLFEARHYRAANNRAYYAIFHAIRSVLALQGFDSKKHSGVIAEFRKSYIKTGVFPEYVSGMIGNAFEIRAASDYDDMFIADREDTLQQIGHAGEIISLVQKYVVSVIEQK